MAREFFCVYHSYRRSLQNLNDAEIGRLIRALLEYSEHGTAPDLPGKEQIAFDFIAANIDREIENYNAKIAALSANGKKGGRPPKTEENQKKQKVFSKSKKSQEEKEDEEEKEKEDEEDLVHPPKSPPGGNAGKKRDMQADFDAFWTAYPKKVDKAKARKVWDKLHPDEALLRCMLNAVKAWKRSEQWTKDGGQFIPNPTTWLNGRRWEDELPNVHKKLSTDPEVSSLNLEDFEKDLLRYCPEFAPPKKEGDQHA